MPFITLPDIKGKIYVPEQDALCPPKHPCRNCFSCQRCSDDRCGLCLAQETSEKPGPDRDGSIQVQGD